MLFVALVLPDICFGQIINTIVDNAINDNCPGLQTLGFALLVWRLTLAEAY